MLTRMLRWFQEAKLRSQSHKAAWVPALSSVANGLSRFQTTLANDIRTTIQTQSLEFEEQIVESGNEANPEKPFRVFHRKPQNTDLAPPWRILPTGSQS